jgi:hypothetical protein
MAPIATLLVASVSVVGIVGTGIAGARATAVPVGYFSTLPPGVALPSDSTCAKLVRPVAEQRADNTVANATVLLPGSFSLAALGPQNGYDSHTASLVARVTGNFVGTTDEIIQWASCKWGFDENVVRAIAITESNWHQSQLGDTTTNAALCPPGVAAPCARSFGIHQVTWNSDPVGTFPASRNSTAFNLDASLLVHRVCFEGYMQWLKNIGYTSYAAGDLWGCVGQWYSGNWHDAAASTYISKVQGYVNTKPWTQPGFSNVTTTTTTTVPAITTTTKAPVTSTTLAPITTTVPVTTTTVAPVCPCVRYDFEGGSTQGWYTGWGPLSVAASTSPVHTGAGALSIQLSPTGANWPAAQVSAPVGLSSGTRVTYWIYAPSGSTLSSVQPYVADLNWNDLLVAPVKLAWGWNMVSWTVPAANGVKGIGLEINDDIGWNGRITLDSVTW